MTSSKSPDRFRPEALGEWGARPRDPRVASKPGPARTGFGLGRIFGIEIRADFSLLIIVLLITVNLGAMAFPAWHPQWSALRSWSLALLAAVAFFASILAHELSHALVARRFGMTVRRITLFLFGGMAHLEDEPPSPKAELWTAAIGPVTSMVIGVLATWSGVALALREVPPGTFDDPMHALRAVGPVPTLLLWLGPLNVVLAVFNMIPGFPLDGGRVLRALVWWRTHDFVKATRWAAGAGRVAGWALMGLGVWNLLAGALMQGLWLVFIGWFLSHAAMSSYQRLLVSKALAHVPVSRVMNTHVDSVSPELSVERLVQDHMIARDQQGFPVQADGILLGFVTLDDVRRVAPDARYDVQVGSIMTPAEALTTLPPEADAERALDLLARRDLDQIPIVERGHVLGLLRRTDLLRWLTLAQPTSS